MSIPVVYSVCRSNPSVNFIYLTRPFMTGMFVNPPANLTVIGVDLKKEADGPAAIARLFGEMKRRYAIDAVADLHNVLRTIILRAVARVNGVATAAIDKGRAAKRRLTRRRRKRLEPLQPQTERYREVFGRLGLATGYDFTSVWGGSPAPATEFAAVTGPKPESERWIGIAPFARHRGKIYPVTLMERVVEGLAADPRNRLFFFGAGPEEENTLQQWTDRIPRSVNMAAKRYGFRTELALMSRFDVMLSMDSANMHLASIAGTKVVSIWGATHPYCGFSGWGQSDDRAIQLTMECRPCSVFGNKPCFRGDYQCMAGIAPGAVIEKIKSVITQ